MRMVAVKTNEPRSRVVLFRARDLSVRQRTQLINALRGHLAEYGNGAPKKTVNVKRLVKALENPQSGLPQLAVEVGQICLDQIAKLTDRIDGLEKQLRVEAAKDDIAEQAQTMPPFSDANIDCLAVGIGPVTAMVATAFTPPKEIIKSNAAFALVTMEPFEERTAKAKSAFTAIKTALANGAAISGSARPSRKSRRRARSQ